MSKEAKSAIADRVTELERRFKVTRLAITRLENDVGELKVGDAALLERLGLLEQQPAPEPTAAHARIAELERKMNVIWPIEAPDPEAEARRDAEMEARHVESLRVKRWYDTFNAALMGYIAQGLQGDVAGGESRVIANAVHGLLNPAPVDDEDDEPAAHADEDAPLPSLEALLRETEGEP